MLQRRQVLTLAAASGLGAIAAPSLASTQTLAKAKHAYYLGEYGEALRAFEQLARSGSAEAAECAAFMLLQGPVFYGAMVRRDVEGAKTLLLQAAAAGRPAASFMLNMLDQGD